MTRPKKSSEGTSKNKSQAFENVKNQLAYCGLWCGSCSVGNGTVNELARRCSKAITDYGVHEWGPKDVDYERLLSGLATLSSMEPCRGCLKGGGRTDCEIRACAVGRGISECAECGSEDTCQNSKLIHHMRSGALGVGMKVKDKAGGRAKTMKEWIAEIEEV